MKIFIGSQTRAALGCGLAVSDLNVFFCPSFILRAGFFSFADGICPVSAGHCVDFVAVLGRAGKCQVYSRNMWDLSRLGRRY